jgi:hypothetical protein
MKHQFKPFPDNQEFIMKVLSSSINNTVSLLLILNYLIDSFLDLVNRSQFYHIISYQYNIIILKYDT